MNLPIIRRIIGYVLILEALLLLAPLIAALIYHESQGFAYIITAAICMICGGLLALKKPKTHVFYLKEGCVATALSWLVLSVFGCLPFVITGEIPKFIDALFETASGFSTTGSSILDNVEAMSNTSLMWRSLTHWIGGMGVLVFILAIVPLSGGSNINLMKAESPGPSVGKLVPKMKETARLLYVIYIVFTLLEFILLVAGRMPVFDAFCTAVGTAGTGGFSVKGDSLASYTPYVQWVVTVFMVMFGINFNLYYFILLRQFKKAFAIEEVKMYFAIVLGATAVVIYNTSHVFNSVSDNIRTAAFQVASLTTSTGFTTIDFDMFPTLTKTLFFLLMLVGACSGSTGGGTKITRWIIMGKAFVGEIHSYLHPKSVKKLKMDGTALDKSIVRSTSIYLFAFSLVFIVSLLIVSIEGYDFTTNFSAVLATINNIGPGMNLAGPTESFSFFSPLSKAVLIFDMLAGRLELFPVLMLFTPNSWKRR